MRCRVGVLVVAIAIAGFGARAETKRLACGWRTFAPTLPANTSLTAIHVRTPTDVWAVGEYGGYPARTPSRTLAIHWDGRRWSRVRTPSFGRTENRLEDVVSLSRRSAWAVGTTGGNANRERALILRWDGRRWSRVGIDLPIGEELHGVAAASERDVWAVGGEGSVARWDGSQWHASQVDVAIGEGGLSDVTVISPDDIWAVGSIRSNPLVARFDGKEWTATQVEEAGGESYAFGVAASASDNVWIVGQLTIEPLVMRWSGERGTFLSVPRAHWQRLSAQRINAQFYDVAVLGPTNVWAVGFAIEHWDGRRWTISGPRSVVATAISAASAQELWIAGWNTSGRPRPIMLRRRCV